MKKGIVTMFMVLGLLVGVVVGLVVYNTSGDVYRGKVIFSSQQEYGEFKQVVSDPNITIEDMLVLSSAPPIVAEFRVKVLHDYPFNYGELATEIMLATGIMAGIMAGIILFLVLLMATSSAVLTEGK